MNGKLFRISRLIGCVLLLAACEGKLSVDLLADAPSTDGTLTLHLNEIRLQRSGGGSENISLDRSVTLGTSGLAPLNLLSEHELSDGEIESIELRFDLSRSQYDHDGDSTTETRDIVLSSGVTGAVASNNRFSISEEETTAINLYINTFASLPAASDADGAAAGTQTLRPIMRLNDAGNGRGLTLTLAQQTILDTQCTDDNAGLPRLYLFLNTVSENDLDGATEDAIRVARPDPLPASGSVRNWRLQRVPEGSYRVALSCSDDDPATAEPIEFFCQQTVSVSGDTSVELTSSSLDPDCVQ